MSERKARELWIHKNLKEVFEVAPWRIGRDAEVIHVIEATPATLIADEMLEMLKTFRKNFCACEPGGGVSDLEPGHICGPCALIEKASK